MLKIHNTLSQKKEILKPLAKAPAFAKVIRLRESQTRRATAGRRDKKLKLFVCGPTVYDFSHLGHARTYLAFDMIVKYLRQKGYDVFYLQNITDLDDKIIKRAEEKNTTPQKLAKDFEKEYLKDVKALKINSVSKYARATDYIKQIISQTERLLKKGYAYEIKGDGIYYDISKFKEYGKLSRRTASGAENAVSRIDESVNKKNKGDFCLWKFSKPGEPSWPFDSSLRSSLRTGLSAGRPGWHIEDTAITEKFFGPQYDIHGGARDLIFPHHEAEISQMEAISGKKPLVKYWLHTGFLTVNGEKMSKSLGNFITIRDFLQEYSPRVLRFLVLKSHYRSPIDYSEKIIEQVKSELARIDEFVDSIRRSDLPKLTHRNIWRSDLLKLRKRFYAAVENDFNIPKAMAAIFKLINEGKSLISENRLNAETAKEILKFLKEIDEFFGFIFWPKVKKKIPETVLNLVKHREEMRKNGNWQKADEIRDQIQQAGYQIEDTKQGPKVKKL